MMVLFSLSVFSWNQEHICLVLIPFFFLLASGHPDPPSSFRQVDFTHNSVTLEWLPGFNGGLRQRFRIRYRKMSDEDLFILERPPSCSEKKFTSGFSDTAGISQPVSCTWTSFLQEQQSSPSLACSLPPNTTFLSMPSMQWERVATLTTMQY